MSKKLVDEEHSLEALQEMIRDRKKGTPVEEILTIFCERYGLTMEACREYYGLLVEKGKIEE
jgi:predicted solute-binding protein